MTKVVIINGVPGSGKDTFVDLCNRYAQNISSYNVYNIHTSDLAKKALRILGYTDEDKGLPVVRHLLSQMISVSEQIWNTSLRYLEKVLGSIHEDGETKNTLFIHCREPENIEKFKTRFNAVTLLIDRKVPLLETENLSDKISTIYKTRYDKYIHNQGKIDALQIEAIIFMKTLWEVS